VADFYLRGHGLYREHTTLVVPAKYHTEQHLFVFSVSKKTRQAETIRYFVFWQNLKPNQVENLERQLLQNTVATQTLASFEGNGRSILTSGAKWFSIPNRTLYTAALKFHGDEHHVHIQLSINAGMTHNFSFMIPAKQDKVVGAVMFGHVVQYQQVDKVSNPWTLPKSMQTLWPHIY
jgi:hypothetical protein